MLRTTDIEIEVTRPSPAAKKPTTRHAGADPMSMEDDVHELLRVLDAIVELLDKDEETHWRTWMHESRTRILNADYSGIEHLLGAFGGMGSFNDLVIAQGRIDGQFAWKPGYKEKNDRLSALRDRAETLARNIRRAYERGC
jgi:hypothetical protein